MTKTCVVRLVSVLLALAIGHATASDKIVRIGLFYGLANPLRAITYSPYAIHPIQFDALVDLDDKGAVLPALALSWTAEAPTTWIFNLRPGVVFSNGEPCDAAAVVATLEYLRSDEGRMLAAYRETRSVIAARVRDAGTVEITTSQPDAMLPAKLFSVKILPPVYFRNVGMSTFERAPVGTGPFREVSRSEARVKFTRAETSWRRAKIEGLDLVMTPDPTARVQALHSGAIDLALDIKPEDIAPLRAAGFVTVSHALAAVSVVQLITNKHPALASPLVRRALNHAVNKQAIVAQILGGQTRVARQFTPSFAFGALADPADPYPFDPARAKTLLDQAGFGDGFAMTIELVNSFDNTVYEQIAADLAKIGVRVTLLPVATQEFTSRLFNNLWQGDAFDYGYIVFPSLDALAPLRLHSCLNPKPWHCDQEIAAKMVAADKEFDLGRRRALTEDVMRALIADPPGILMHEAFRTLAYRPAITGFESPLGLIRYERLDLQ